MHFSAPSLPNETPRGLRVEAGVMGGVSATVLTAGIELASVDPITAVVPIAFGLGLSAVSGLLWQGSFELSEQLEKEARNEEISG